MNVNLTTMIVCCTCTLYLYVVLVQLYFVCGAGVGLVEKRPTQQLGDLSVKAVKAEDSVPNLGTYLQRSTNYG